MNLYFILGAILASFVSGCYVTHLYQGNATKGAAIVAEHRAAEGSTKIIHDTQIITKVIHDTKDNCLNKPVPADLAKRLR